MNHANSNKDEVATLMTELITEQRISLKCNCRRGFLQSSRDQLVKGANI